MFSKTQRIVATLALTVTLGAPPLAHAEILDLTSGEGAGGVINGALFQFQVVQPAGTGVLDSFVRIQDIGSEQGYNTSGRPVPFDEKTDPNFTRDVTFGELSVVEVGDIEYLQFLLDINEPNNHNSLITLTELQIYTSPEGSQTTTDVPSLGVLRYDLDSLADNSILLDHNAAEGSGKTDMVALIPLAFFDGTADTDFIYLYSAFTDSQAGFEEWSVQTAGNEPPRDGGGQEPIPAPLALPAGLALLGMLGLRRKLRGGRS